MKKSRKLLFFNIIDISIIIFSCIRVIIANNKKSYGLEALSNVGIVVVFGLLFISSSLLLIIVNIVSDVRRKNKEKKLENEKDFVGNEWRR